MPDRLTQITSGKLNSTMTFNEKVYALCARVPAGSVVTYGDIAKKLGTKGYRAVGNALNKNPYAPQVPCHRVVGSTGNLTGFAEGISKKEQLLRKEGVPVKDNRVVLTDCRFAL